MKDLEIRGAGNLLGRRAARPHRRRRVRDVPALLAEAVAEMKGEPLALEREVRIDLPVKAFIPPDWLGQEALRLELYRRIGTARDAEELSHVAEEATDRFGIAARAPSAPCFAVASLKLACLVAGIEEVSTFRTQVRIKPVEEASGLEVAEAVAGASYHPTTRTLNLEPPANLGGEALAGWVRAAITPSPRIGRMPPDPASSEGPVPSKDGGLRILELLRVMHRLRAPGGCPWDREQTHASLARHLLEETHETLEAIDSGDPERLRDELGDVLLQVVFHAEVAAEEGTFDIDDVAAGVVTKLIRRHPHVFGDVQVGSAAQVLVNWERSSRRRRAASTASTTRSPRRCRRSRAPPRCSGAPPGSDSTGEPARVRWRRCARSWPSWMRRRPTGSRRSWGTCSSRWRRSRDG